MMAIWSQNEIEMAVLPEQEIPDMRRALLPQAVKGWRGRATNEDKGGGDDKSAHPVRELPRLRRVW